MPKYIVLGSYTAQGIQKMAQSPQRLEAARQAASDLGGELGDFYLTLGRYDFVTVADFPSDSAYTRWALGVAAAGNVRTETLRAFEEGEYREITGAL